jgi:hypothetical protein
VGGHPRRVELAARSAGKPVLSAVTSSGATPLHTALYGAGLRAPARSPTSPPARTAPAAPCAPPGRGYDTVTGLGSPRRGLDVRAARRASELPPDRHDRQVLPAAEHARRPALRTWGGGHRREPVEQRPQPDLALDARERGADAEVASAGEGQVLAGVLARDVEALGSAKTSGSRLAAASSVVTWAPAATGTPATVVSRTAPRR